MHWWILRFYKSLKDVCVLIVGYCHGCKWQYIYMYLQCSCTIGLSMHIHAYVAKGVHVHRLDVSSDHRQVKEVGVTKGIHRCTFEDKEVGVTKGIHTCRCTFEDKEVGMA